MQHARSRALAALPALEAAVSFVQAAAEAAPARAAWLLTHGAHQVGGAAHAAVYGLARAARAEAMLPHSCVDAASDAAVFHRAKPPEEEGEDYAAEVARLSGQAKAPEPEPEPVAA